MPLKSERRKIYLRKLVHDGNYHHNMDVLRSGKVKLYPVAYLGFHKGGPPTPPPPLPSPPRTSSPLPSPSVRSRPP